MADAVFKASLLLGAAGLASVALRRASASARHLVWTLALIGALVVPALSLSLPRWRVPVVAMPGRARRRAAGSAGADSARARAGAPRATQRGCRDRHAAAPPACVRDGRRTGRRADSIARVARQRLRWETLAVALWLAGFLAILARLVVGLIGVQWMSRRTEVVTDAPWLPLARRLAADLGVSTSRDLPAQPARDDADGVGHRADRRC